MKVTIVKDWTDYTLMGCSVLTILVAIALPFILNFIENSKKRKYELIVFNRTLNNLYNNLIKVLKNYDDLQHNGSICNWKLNYKSYIKLLDDETFKYLSGICIKFYATDFENNQIKISDILKIHEKYNNLNDEELKEGFKYLKFRNYIVRTNFKKEGVNELKDEDIKKILKGYELIYSRLIKSIELLETKYNCKEIKWHD